MARKLVGGITLAMLVAPLLGGLAMAQLAPAVTAPQLELPLPGAPVDVERVVEPINVDDLVDLGVPMGLDGLPMAYPGFAVHMDEDAAAYQAMAWAEPACLMRADGLSLFFDDAYTPWACAQARADPYSVQGTMAYTYQADPEGITVLDAQGKILVAPPVHAPAPVVPQEVFELFQPV